jgi:hypothetical protein
MVLSQERFKAESIKLFKPAGISWNILEVKNSCK